MVYLWVGFTVLDLWKCLSWAGPYLLPPVFSLLRPRRLGRRRPRFRSSHLPPGAFLLVPVLLPQRCWQPVCLSSLLGFPAPVLGRNKIFCSLLQILLGIMMGSLPKKPSLHLWSCLYLSFPWILCYLCGRYLGPLLPSLRALFGHFSSGL